MLASKNFSRNKKRYRATVISLFLSVSLFISASSFCSYLTDAVTGVAGAYTPVDADVGVSLNDDNYDPSELLNVILSTEHVDTACFVSNCYLSYITLDKACLTDDYINSPSRENTDNERFKYSPTVRLCFVDDSTFKNYCEAVGVKSDDYFNKDNPQGIAYNTAAEIYVDSYNNDKYYICNVFEKSKLPITVVNEELNLTIDDYTIDYYDTNDDTERDEYYYYPTEYYEKYSAAYGTQVEFPIDTSLAKIVAHDEAVNETVVKIGALTDTLPYFTSSSNYVVLVYPMSMAQYVSSDFTSEWLCGLGSFYVKAQDHLSATKELTASLKGYGGVEVLDIASNDEMDKMLITVITVFSYGFIALISLIATANVFNTVSTSIALRRREFAMLRSVGLTAKGFMRMMNYECLIYGFKALLYGIPFSVAVTYIIYKAVGTGVSMGFYIPIHSIIIAVSSVFAVVFATMLYSTRKIKTENPIDGLRNENL